MNKKNKVEKIKTTTLPEMKTLKKLEDGLKLSGFLSQIVNQRLLYKSEKAHYWATYVLHALKNCPEIKAYHDNNKELEGYKEYQSMFEKLQQEKDPEKRKEIDKKIEKQCKDYIEKRNDLQKEDLGLQIRPFMVDWIKKTGASTEVSGILVEFDLFDNPSKLLDYLYSEDE